MSPVSAAKIQTISERQEKLTALTKQPGWSELKRTVEAKQKDFEHNLMVRYLSPNPTAAPADQRELDYWRGFFACAKYLIAAPENAEKTLEMALKGANLLRSN